VLSVISLAEVVYLVEKNRLPGSAYADLQTVLRDPDHVLQEAPVTAEIIDAMLEVPRVDIPDMPDFIPIAHNGPFGLCAPHCRGDGSLFWRPCHQSRWPHPLFQCADHLVVCIDEKIRKETGHKRPDLAGRPFPA